MPGAVNTFGQLSISGIRRMQADVDAMYLGGSVDDVVSKQGIVGKPKLEERIFAIVRDYVENVHSWDEADLSDPKNPRIMNGGRRGTINGDSSSSDTSSSDSIISDQPAYDFNGNSHEPGTVIYIQRTSFDAWGIICCAGDSSSDAGFTFTIDCEAGTIIVGNEEPQTPTTDPNTEGGGGTTPQDPRKKTGGSGAITNTTGDPGIP